LAPPLAPSSSHAHASAHVASTAAGVRRRTARGIAKRARRCHLAPRLVDGEPDGDALVARRERLRARASVLADPKERAVVLVHPAHRRSHGCIIHVIAVEEHRADGGHVLGEVEDGAGAVLGDTTHAAVDEEVLPAAVVAEVHEAVVYGEVRRAVLVDDEGPGDTAATGHAPHGAIADARIVDPRAVEGDVVRRPLRRREDHGDGGGRGVRCRHAPVGGQQDRLAAPGEQGDGDDGRERGRAHRRRIVTVEAASAHGAKAHDARRRARSAEDRHTRDIVLLKRVKGHRSSSDVATACFAARAAPGAPHIVDLGVRHRLRADTDAPRRRGAAVRRRRSPEGFLRLRAALS
jgi:hypothetical protein